MTSKPTLHSHTHCQVAQADPQAKTWQRVCLSNRTINSENHDRQEGQQLTAPTCNFLRVNAQMCNLTKQKTASSCKTLCPIYEDNRKHIISSSDN